MYASPNSINYTKKERKRDYQHPLINLIEILSILLLAYSNNVQARPNETSLASDQLGLIVAQTKTTTGHEFCQGFLNYWRELPNTENVNLTLAESVDALNGLQIIIYYGGKIVFQTSLSQTSGVDPKQGQQVSQVVHYRVMAQNRQQGKWFDPDLAPDEW